ncbi:hypothetical protein M23134_08459 [Microscilla marina ATCC 23134]|uniref:Uncharacterized protein n=2 Tax=Microscilla marina TaxID=1027 RepID=A1ZR96_MICM2|nr:hypothetical protein M23134_08459 [Microscilla marina ATCC 23134]
MLGRFNSSGVVLEQMVLMIKQGNINAQNVVLEIQHFIALKKINPLDAKNIKEIYPLAKEIAKNPNSEFAKAIKGNSELIEAWAVLHKSGADEATKLGKKGELEEIRKYLDDNPSKTIDDVAKEIKNAGEYKKWVKTLVKSNNSGFTSVKIGTMRTLPKAKKTASNMEKGLEVLLSEYKQKFAGLAKNLPDRLKVIFSNSPPSGYSHSTTVDAFVSRMQKKNVKLSPEDIKTLKTMEVDGKLEKVLVFANITYSNKSATVLKKYLEFRGVIAHELGHAFHWNTGMVTNSSFIHRSVDNLYTNCENVFNILPQSTLQLLKPQSARELRKVFGKQVNGIDDKALEYYWDAIGDLSLALSKGKTGFGRLDKLSYYSSKNTPQKELIAHTSDYYLNGNPLVEKVFGKNMKALLDDFGNTYFK